MSIHERVAVLDVDRMLLSGTTGLDLLQALLEAGVCDPALARTVFEIVAACRGGRLEPGVAAPRAARAFGLALAGHPAEVVEGLARRTWARARGELRPFVPELLRLLRGRGYEPMLISGSPNEMVGLIAADLGIERAYGAVLARRLGRYTGAVELTPGVPGHKSRVLASALRGRLVDLGASLALCASIADLDLLDLLGTGLVLEPSPELATAALARELPLATQDDLLEQTEALLDAVQARRPRPGTRRADDPRRASGDLHRESGG